jgi:sugar phosphate isomerase/epimerase
MSKDVNRRGFLKIGGLAAAAGLIPEMAKAQPGLMPSPIRLGIASYTFRSFERTKMIEDLKQLRITTLNCKDVKDHLPSTSPEAEQAAVDAYKAAGITLTACGTIYFSKDEDADIRAKFEYAKAAGIKVIVAGDPEAKVLPRIEKFIKEYDIKVAIHNHGPEDKLWASPLDVLKFLKGMDPRIGCCIDVGHTMRAGTNVVEAIKAVGPRLFDMHIKDLAQEKVKESQVAVGEGIMPIKAIFQALIAIKYQGNVDLEYEINGDNPMPGVIESIAYMRGVLAGMGYSEGPRGVPPPAKS